MDGPLDVLDGVEASSIAVHLVNEGICGPLVVGTEKSEEGRDVGMKRMCVCVCVCARVRRLTRGDNGVQSTNEDCKHTATEI